jgi:cell division transport system ATP-binding protein
MIQFEKVTKMYGKHAVLNRVSLGVTGGEFVTLIGSSGAGKSTLLHALIGSLPIDGGSILVDGYEITEFTPDALQEYRRKVGMVFQDYKLLEKKTVYENVAFALEVCGWKDEDIRERVYEVLSIVGMLDHEGKFPAQLAGGEVQRTAIARALVHRPRLFIADEPTGNLDFWHAQGIIDLLLKINDAGVTVLMATHNREIVDQIQRRVVTINDGRIIADKETTGYDVDSIVGHQLAEMMAEDGVGDIEIHEVIEVQ